MLTLFCVRLAGGLAGSLLLLSTAAMNPRFYRAQNFIIIGLCAIAVGDEETPGIDIGGIFLRAGMMSACLGQLLWCLDTAPFGRTFIVISAVLLTAALITTLGTPAVPTDAAAPELGRPWQIADNLTSAAVLGTAMTAMLVGHSYLIAPSMSLTPLYRLLAALALSVGIRAILAALGLWYWSRGHSLTNWEDETVLWLPLRWGLGVVGPCILAWMAWQTARIRSTQSATGILYVVVIFCFLGELTSQLLWRNTGYVL